MTTKSLQQGNRAKKVVEYVLDDQQKDMLRGRRNGFVFDIRSEILWIDDITGGKFHSKHYSPLVHQEVPNLQRGTIAYEDFWDEQDRRCLEGYAPIVDGVQYPRITGPHYFYLNMYQILMLKEGKRRKELWYPYYRALDHMIFLELEKAEEEGYGIIVGKSRRMGLSYIGSVMILWNMLFFKHNTVAVGAGKEDKAIALFKKVLKSMDNIRDEYRVSYRSKKEEMVMAYKVSLNGIRKDDGILSQLDIKTFFSDPSAFEGGSYSFFIFEEIGIHDNLIKSYKASEPCFTEGATQFGVPFLFGTGGEVDKGSKDFKIMMANPASYNLKKLFIPKYMYYPSSAPKKKKGVQAPKNLLEAELDSMDANVNFFDVRTGLNDEQGALKHILKRREVAKKSKEGYIKEVQSNAIKESDIFLKTDGGVLDRILLSSQREAIYNGQEPYKWKKYRMEWKDPDHLAVHLARCRNTKERALIRIKYKVSVEMVEDDNGKIYCLDGFKPINKDDMIYKPDIQGTDSYDEENVVESGSLGCSIIYRCFNGLSNTFDLPICVLSERGEGGNEDTFFDNNLKMSVYWNAENLIEYTKVALVYHYQDVYAHHYLRVNPDLDTAVVTNRGKQEFGLRMTSGQKGIKALVTTLLKMEVKENIDKYCFDFMIDDLIDYGDKNTDIAMALGVCLVHKMDMFDYISEDLEETVTDNSVLNMAYYGEDEDGNLTVNMYETPNAYDDIEVFDSRKHLTGDKRENYLNFVEAEKKAKAAAKRKREEAFKLSQIAIEDPFATARQDYINKQIDNGNENL